MLHRSIRWSYDTGRWQGGLCPHPLAGLEKISEAKLTAASLDLSS